MVLERGQWTAEELSDHTEAPYPTVTREIRRLQRCGIVTVTTVGRTKLLSLDTADPVARALVRTVALDASRAERSDVAKKKSKKKGNKKSKKK